jgi:hypothetical protein
MQRRLASTAGPNNPVCIRTTISGTHFIFQQLQLNSTHRGTKDFPWKSLDTNHRSTELRALDGRAAVNVLAQAVYLFAYVLGKAKRTEKGYFQTSANKIVFLPPERRSAKAVRTRSFREVSERCGTCVWVDHTRPFIPPTACRQFGVLCHHGDLIGRCSC